MTNLADHPVTKLRSPGRPYVLDRFHPDRLSTQGYLMEMRVWLASLGKPQPKCKFIVVGRPRCGSELLTRLLNQVPAIRCESELLHNAVLAPRMMVHRLAAKSQAEVYGFKWLSYQMLEVQNLRDCRRTIERLNADGIKFIHLKRNSFDQAKSILIANETLRFTSRSPGEQANIDFEVSPEEFQSAYEWSEAMLDYEIQLMKGMEVFEVDFAKHLRDSGNHQTTIDEICAFLGTQSAPVRADVRRERNAKITNIEALRAQFQPE